MSSSRASADVFATRCRYVFMLRHHPRYLSRHIAVAAASCRKSICRYRTSLAKWSDGASSSTFRTTRSARVSRVERVTLRWDVRSAIGAALLHRPLADGKSRCLGSTGPWATALFWIVEGRGSVPLTDYTCLTRACASCRFVSDARASIHPLREGAGRRRGGRCALIRP